MTPIALTMPDVDEVLRYMGTPPQAADEALRTLVSQCGTQLLEVAQPRWTHQVFDLSFEADGVRLSDGLLLPGQALREHLEGCSKVCLLGATLGSQADTLIRRAQCTDMVQALALDCCASALIEQLCDRAEQLLQAQFPSCSFPYRFSPGYGDLPLEVNTALLALLDAPRTIGLCATDHHLLTPRKSVTALLGVSERPIKPKNRSCLGCPAHDGCHYRKSGGHCGIS